MRHCETASQTKSKQSQKQRLLRPPQCVGGQAGLFTRRLFGGLEMTIMFSFILQCIPIHAETDSYLALSKEDRALLKKIQKDTFQYFLIHTDAQTGLTKDSSRSGAPASIAATGFALASFSIASQNGWLSYREAYERVERTMSTLENRAAEENGFFYHFLDPKTGKRIWASEVSSIDTALLMAGVLLAASYFNGTGLELRAKKLYERVHWEWMLNGSLLFSHGWKPKQGFLPYYWDIYAEHLILQALALGSETHPVPIETWTAWTRDTDSFNHHEIVYAYTGSLFTYQYSHAFIDFRNISDQGINYFQNSKEASLANKEFCELNQNEYQTYQNGIWGLSASLGPDGYKPYGAQPGLAFHDGTIASYGAISSMPFTPTESMVVVRMMYEKYGSKLYGPLGFKEAFNFDRKWWTNEYLGIDQGIIVLMLENVLNDGVVWKRFMKLPMIQRWLERTHLRTKPS
ncbi:MAG: hypothetical protein HYS55_06680 [Candidatus Omnitrophica bacterium]|nr:hypothetical protein [Candidatus Omnitrophota bacterium]